MKLDFRNDSSFILSEVSRLLGLAPVLMLLAAVLMLTVATLSVRDYLSSRSRTNQLKDLPEFSVKVNPVGKSVYEDYASVLGRLSRSVKVTGSDKGLRIEIRQAADYPEFMYVLNSVQGVSKDVVWKADEICLAKCKEAYSYALIKGVRETVAVKLRG